MLSHSSAHWQAHLFSCLKELTFADMDMSAAAIHRVDGDYSRHAGAAFAREFLDSDLVLGRLLELVGM